MRQQLINSMFDVSVQIKLDRIFYITFCFFGNFVYADIKSMMQYCTKLQVDVRVRVRTYFQYSLSDLQSEMK